MIIVTTNEIPGYRVLAVHGEVMGLTVRARDFGANFIAGFRSLGGGEIPEFTQALYESRMQVMSRMVGEAEQRGANAIIGMRFDASEIGQAWTEICAYGTAVIVEPIPHGEPGATVQSSSVANSQQGRPQRAQQQPAHFAPQPGPPSGQPMPGQPMPGQYPGR
ncbi:YbjQ family protein [Humidisolicoccus flavus]|uniref:YbjQ family protein n=1 Tax=Humidisolicoccus flavus TaxID=3111414 RepID=UPI00324C5E45